MSDDETRIVLKEILDDEDRPLSAITKIDNIFLFKVPLNVAIADHKPEREFIRQLIEPDNAPVIDSWIKCPDQEFDPIEYSWRKGEHAKRGFFNSDFFIKQGSHILVVEIKGDEELQEPSDENKGKYRAAVQHFETLNNLKEESVYHFHFLTPTDYDTFFHFLRESNYDFMSKLDAELGKENA